MVRASGSPTSGSGRPEHCSARRALHPRAQEQVLWTQGFDTIEDLRLALLAFKERYNREWLVKRHGHRTPSQVRAILEADLAA